MRTGGAAFHETKPIFPPCADRRLDLGARQGGDINKARNRLSCLMFWSRYPDGSA
jgi:hypothetical protein